MMIELYWGEPLHFVVTTEGDIQKFSTIEQAQYWLRKKWPVQDQAREAALTRISAAMDCLDSVANARQAFIAAAKSAGFQPQAMTH